MSQCIKIKMRIKDKETLAEALKELGLKVEIGENLSVKTYAGGKTAVEIKVKGTGGAWQSNICSDSDGYYSIGFAKTADGTYEMVGDDYWPMMKNEKFKNQISQKCSEILVKQECESNGYMISDMNVDEHGNMHIQATEY